MEWRGYSPLRVILEAAPQALPSSFPLYTVCRSTNGVFPDRGLDGIDEDAPPPSYETVTQVYYNSTAFMYMALPSLVAATSTTPVNDPQKGGNPSLSYPRWNSQTVAQNYHGNKMMYLIPIEREASDPVHHQY